MIEPLLNRAHPYPGESLYSLLYRNAIKNRFPHLGQMLSEELGPLAYKSNLNYFDNKMNWVPFVNEFIRFKVLFEKIDTLVLNQFDQVLFQKAPNFIDQRIFYNRNHSTFCPLCLKENFFYHLIWDFSFITVCLKHRIILIDRCKKCGKRIQLSRLMRNECKCGYNFVDIRVVIDADSNLIIIQEYIRKLLLGNEDSIKMEQFDITLTNFEYFQLFYLFGKVIDGLPIKGNYYFNGNITANFSRLTDKERDIVHLSELVKIIHELIMNPKKELPKILHIIDNQIFNLSKKIRQYKYTFFNKIVSHNKGEVYHRVYSDYLNNLDNEILKSRAVIKPIFDDKKYVTFYEVQTKTNAWSLNSLERFNLINVIRKEQNGKEIKLVELESVKNYLEKKESSYNIAKIVKITGLSHRTVCKLIDFGILNVIHESKDVNKTWYIGKKEVDNLMDSLFKGTEEIETINENFIHFKDASKSVSFLGGDLEYLIKVLINNCKISKYILNGQKNFRGLYISREDFKIIETHLKNEQIEYYGYNIREVQRKLKIGVRKLDKLLEDGRLEIGRIEKVWNGQIIRYFSKESVERLRVEMK